MSGLASGVSEAHNKPKSSVIEKSVGYKHFTEDNHYEIDELSHGKYKISSVISEEFLNNPETIYPVIIDPSTNANRSVSNVEDSYVDAGNENANYGSYPNLRFGNKGGKSQIGYVRFINLPVLPAGSCITDASLKLTFRPNQTTGDNGICFIVTNHQWYEDSITSKNQPYGEWGYYSSHNNFKFYDFYVAPFVRGWYSGRYYNYGVNFAYDTEKLDYNSVYSSEGSASESPLLTIYYNYYGTTSGISSSETYYIKNLSTGKYLDGTKGGDVIQYSYHGNANQQWKVVYQDSGLYKLYNHYSENSESKYCLDLVSQSSNDVDLWYDGSGEYLLFNILPNGDGTFRIQPRWTYGLEVLTVSNATSSDLYISEWTGDSRQKWVFEARTSKGIINHAGNITMGISADNYGNSSSSGVTCNYGFRVSTHTANGFSYGIDNNRMELKFYNYNYGSSHSYTWATKKDLLSKKKYSITTPNIDDVNLMLFVGHGSGGGFHYSHGSAGTSHIDNPSNHNINNNDLWLLRSEAKFGFGSDTTKWVFAYTCNFLTGNLSEIQTIMQGCNVVLGYSGQAYLAEPIGRAIGTNMKNGQTVINSFFNATSVHRQYTDGRPTFRAVFVNDAVNDTIFKHLKAAGTYRTEYIRMLSKDSSI